MQYGHGTTKAREMALHDEGKGTQATADLRGLGVRISGPRNHPCEALKGDNSEELERDCGVNGDLQSQSQALG